MRQGVTQPEVRIMKTTIEIRAAEGGDDAKALVHEQGAIYQAYAARKALNVRVSPAALG